MTPALNYAPDHLKGKQVRIGNLKGTMGLIVAPKHIEARRANTTGKFLQFVPGHGGDAIAVQHSNSIAVYLVGEFRFIKPVRKFKDRVPRKKKKRQAFQVIGANGDILNFKTWNMAFEVWRHNRDYLKTIFLQRPLKKNPDILPQHIKRP